MMKISASTQSPPQADHRRAVEQAKARKRIAWLLGKLLVYSLLIGGAIIFIIPFMWMVST